MKVLIAADYPIQCQDGKYFVGSNLYYILKRYYEAFGKLFIYTRVDYCEPDNTYLAINDFLDKVFETTLIDCFSRKCMGELNKLVDQMDLVIGRFDSIVACRASESARKHNKTFLAELMADAWDGYWNHGLKGKIIAPYMYFSTKAAVINADYAIYVTNHHLQKRYPCRNISISASNVNIPDEPAIVLEQRIQKIRNMDIKRISLLTSGGINVKAKGQKYVIKAMPQLIKHGIDVHYYLAGLGDNSFLMREAINNKVQNNVHFCGNLSIDSLKRKIEEVDIYIQPSLQEGLPRSVIEAMSRGCPCVGSKTAGTPELLDNKYIFKRKSAKDIERAILSILDKRELENMATRNFKEAKKYVNFVLDARRKQFFENILIDITKKSKY